MTYYSKVKVKILKLEQFTGSKYVRPSLLIIRLYQLSENLHLNKNIISNYCVKCKHTSSMHKRGVCIISSVADFKNI